MSLDQLREAHKVALARYTKETEQNPLFNLAANGVRGANISVQSDGRSDKTSFARYGGMFPIQSIQWLTSDGRDVWLIFKHNYAQFSCLVDGQQVIREGISLTDVIHVLDYVRIKVLSIWGHSPEVTGLLDSTKFALAQLKAKAAAAERALRIQETKEVHLEQYLCQDVAGLVEEYAAQPLLDGTTPPPVYGSKRKSSAVSVEEEPANKRHKHEDIIVVDE